MGRNPYSGLYVPLHIVRVSDKSDCGRALHIIQVAVGFGQNARLNHFAVFGKKQSSRTNFDTELNIIGQLITHRHVQFRRMFCESLHRIGTQIGNRTEETIVDPGIDHIIFCTQVYTDVVGPVVHLRSNRCR